VVLALEGRLLDDRPGSILGPPQADLAAAVESPGSHEAAVLAEELPGSVHLAVEVRSAESDLAVLVVVDRRYRGGGVVRRHGARISTSP
jgi:hypothetical protein